MKKIILITLMISIIIIGCKKDNSDDSLNPGYQIITGQTTNITNTSAIVEGEISNIKWS